MTDEQPGRPRWVPPWLWSRKWTAYVVTLAALVGLAALRADADALAYVALAVATGLPVLLGGQSAVDWVAASTIRRKPPKEPTDG